MSCRVTVPERRDLHGLCANSNIRFCCCPNVLADGDQERARFDTMIRSTRTLQYGWIDTLERAVRPGARLPRVPRCFDGRHKRNLGRSNIDSSDVVNKLRRRAPEVEAHIAVVPSSIALDSQLPGISIIDESLLRIPKRHAVAHNMVCRRIVGNPELEPVAVAVEVVEIPAVETVPPGVDLFHGDRGAEHEEVEPVIHVVPQTGVPQTVALTGAFFAGESVSGFAVFAWVAVAVRIKVDDCVI